MRCAPSSKRVVYAVYIESKARALEGEAARLAHDNVYAARFTTSHLPEGGAHIFAAPIGVLNELKTKDQMMYYHAAGTNEAAV